MDVKEMHRTKIDEQSEALKRWWMDRRMTKRADQEVDGKKRKVGIAIAQNGRTNA